MGQKAGKDLVHHGETGEKEKQNSPCTVERGRIGDPKALRSRLIRGACAASHLGPWWCLDTWLYPPIGFLFGQSDLSGLYCLPPEAMVISWCAVILPMGPCLGPLSYSWGFVSETKLHGLGWCPKPCWYLRVIMSWPCHLSTVGKVLAEVSESLGATQADKLSYYSSPDTWPWIAHPNIHSIYELHEHCKEVSPAEQKL